MKRFAAETSPLEGTVLVEASAGTGKTHAITTLALRLLLEKDLGIEQILVVTFTEAATAELRDRMRARVRLALAASTNPRDRARLRQALQHVDEAPIQTIHGFCHRVLGDSAFDSGVQFDAELLTDDTPLLEDVLYDFWTAELAGESRTGVRMLRALGLKPEQTRGLASEVLRAPYLPILPAMDDLSREPDADALRRAFAAMRQSWDRAAVEEALRSPALNRNRYPEKSIARDVDAMEAMLSRPLVDVPEYEPHIKKMTAQHLEKSVTSKFQGKQPRHAFFTACDALRVEIERFAHWGAARKVWFKRRLIDYVRVQMPRRKEQSGAMSFDDLLLKLDDALAGPRGERLAASVRRRYPAALIDEFQDTDPVQWAIFERIWGRHGALYLIGDPKQAIYGFRGADVFAYMQAARAVDDERRFTMDTNWRSDPSLVAGVNALFSRATHPFLMRAIGFPEVVARRGAKDALSGAARSGLEILFAPRAAETHGPTIMQATAADISRLLASDAHIDGEPIAPGDIAVLTRSNKQAFAAQRALRALGVASVVLGDQSVFEEDQPEARELAFILAAVAEPTHTAAVRAALTSDLIGVSASELCAMDEGRDDGAWARWIDMFRELNAIWAQRGFVQMFRALMSLTSMEQRLLARDDGERRITNVLHLMELLHTAASTLHLGPVSLLQWLEVQRAPQNAKARPEAAQIRLESDDDAVKITTIHRSKGLEYPIVYCPSSWEGTLLFPDEKQNAAFHDPDDGEVKKLDLAPEKGQKSLARAEWEKLSESLRLLYVALTRAKQRCSVVWGAVRSSHHTAALGYLLHPPPLAGDVQVADIEAHLDGLDDVRMLAEIEALAASSGGALSVRPLDMRDAGVPYVARRRDGAHFVARSLVSPIERCFRVASFSELAQSRKPRGLMPTEPRDHDAFSGAPPHVEDPADAPVGAIPVAPLGAIALSSFPRGPRAGNFFHELFEELDFQEDDRIGLIESKLSAHGYDVERHAEQVDRALTDILDTPLPLGKRSRVTLRHIPRAQRLDELEFYLPVASAVKRTIAPRGSQLSLFADASSPGGVPAALHVRGASGARGRLTARAIADALAAHPSPALHPGYAEGVGRLTFAALEGYLKGFIDLVYVHDDRWYLADYKTNHLGDDLSDYATARLPLAMAHGHYYLQYHLYAVALHRYLGRRIRRYDYDKHFGGVQYLFVKGMSPKTHGTTGVFSERPPRARIEALSDLIEHPPDAIMRRGA